MGERRRTKNRPRAAGGPEAGSAADAAGKANGNGSGARPADRVRSLLRLAWVAVIGLAVLALVNAYGRTLTTFIQDTWGPDFSYFDNGQMILTKLHRLPPATAAGQTAPPGQAAPPTQTAPASTWPEAVLRPACQFTLSLMGLSGPEGGLWQATLEGKEPAQYLVVRATATGAEVGRYRVLEGSPQTGLAVVELNAGPNGLHLMDVLQPTPRVGWYVVQVYRVSG